MTLTRFAWFICTSRVQKWFILLWQNWKMADNIYRKASRYTTSSWTDLDNARFWRCNRDDIDSICMIYLKLLLLLWQNLNGKKYLRQLLLLVPVKSHVNQKSCKASCLEPGYKSRRKFAIVKYFFCLIGRVKWGMGLF